MYLPEIIDEPASLRTGVEKNQSWWRYLLILIIIVPVVNSYITFLALNNIFDQIENDVYTFMVFYSMEYITLGVCAGFAGKYLAKSPFIIPSIWFIIIAFTCLYFALILYWNGFWFVDRKPTSEGLYLNHFQINWLLDNWLSSLMKFVALSRFVPFVIFAFAMHRREPWKKLLAFALLYMVIVELMLWFF